MTVATDIATRDLDKRMLDLAARCAWRAVGRVEPNPMVGCVFGSAEGEVFAIGHHRRFGGAHAEVDALRIAAERGIDVRGATAWVTLEPCNHEGKTPPCAGALLEAGIGEVVIASLDPTPSGGGARTLRDAGVHVRETNASADALLISAPFRKRATSGLPWLVAKWAQTIDGRIATSAGESQWISSERSRAVTHNWRGRVDAMIVGIGTALHDNPRLTARSGRPPRRTPRRVVLDPRLRLPLESALSQSANEAPVTLICLPEAAESQQAKALRARGVDLLPIQPGIDGRPDLRTALAALASDRNVTTAIVEGGPKLLGAMLRDDLIDMAAVFVAPMLMADPQAPGAAAGESLERLQDAHRFRLRRIGRIEDDALLVYTRRDDLLR